jgi:Zn-finger nucleic acid-binding protein
MLKCPKCELAMQPIEYQGVEIDRCPGCFGLWFDAFEHEELKELSGSESIDFADAQLGPETPVPRVACPRCAVAMFPMVVAGQPHIVYEACGVCHGVFFDAGEFRDFRDETFGEKLRAYFGTARAAGMTG